MDNIKVALRVKPLLSSDKAVNDFECLHVAKNGKSIEVKVEPLKTETYRCSRCFPAIIQQQEFYEGCGVVELLDTALKGSPVCAIAFGESGSGKSHSLFGHQRCGGANERSAGIIPRSVKHVADTLYERHAIYRLFLTCTAIANEAAFDLLADSSRGPVPLTLLETAHGEYVLHNATFLDCTRYGAVVELLDRIDHTRSELRKVIHRSHCLVQLHIHVAADGTDTMVPVGTVSFVDLVNSDGLRMDSNNVTDQYDHSLYVFSKVIDGIEHENNDNTNVTDSVLTSLLSQSIGIRSRCLLISCIQQGRFHLLETLKTLRFSCVHVPKLPKYLDPQAKLMFDLKSELHYLHRQNRQLRDTMIMAPTWELHSLAHTSAAAKRQEAQEEKALIEMHNSILRANETYKFKPRTGGRMYFPSHVAGKQLPLKPQPSVDEILKTLRSGSLDGSSQFSALLNTTLDSAGEPAEDPSLISPSRGPGSRSKSQSQAQSHATRKSGPASSSKEVIDDMLRRRGSPGPMVFKMRVRSSDSQDRGAVPELRPLRETTQLGFNREAVSVPLEDWPVVIRHRVAAAEQEVKGSDDHQLTTGATAATMDERTATRPTTSSASVKGSIKSKGKGRGKPEEAHKFNSEELLGSPFVAHLVHKIEKQEERPSFEVRLNPLESAWNSRPVTAPHSKTDSTNPDPTRRRRTTTSDSQLKARELLALAKPRLSSAKPRRVTSATPSGAVTRSTSSSALQALSSGPGTARSHDTAETLALEPASPAEESPASPVGFNPRKPSVFAASLHSDQYNLNRRPSTFTSIESFTNRVLNRELSSTLAPSIPEEDRDMSTKSALGELPVRGAMQKQRSERMALARAGSVGVNTDGPGSNFSHGSSFSSLPSVDRGSLLTKQRSKRVVM